MSRNTKGRSDGPGEIYKCLHCPYPDDCCNCLDHPETIRHGANSKYSDAAIIPYIRGEKHAKEIAEKYQIHQSTVYEWKRRYMRGRECVAV